jgi:hypothetical protein
MMSEFLSAINYVETTSNLIIFFAIGAVVQRMYFYRKQKKCKHASAGLRQKNINQSERNPNPRFPSLREEAKPLPYTGPTLKISDFIGEDEPASDGADSVRKIRMHKGAMPKISDLLGEDEPLSDDSESACPTRRPSSEMFSDASTTYSDSPELADVMSAASGESLDKAPAGSEQEHACVRARDTNHKAQKLLYDQWKQSQQAPVELAKQVYQMLTSSNIPLHAATYRQLCDIAIHGECLEMATEMSVRMEAETGTKLPKGMLNRMVALHVASNQTCSVQWQRDTHFAEMDELVTKLTKHPWYSVTSTRLQQKHQIYVGAQGKLHCLNMTTNGNPRFTISNLTWGWADTGEPILHWGTNSRWIANGSICADIASGTLVWKQWGPVRQKWSSSYEAEKWSSSYEAEHQWKWFAWHTQLVTQMK